MSAGTNQRDITIGGIGAIQEFFFLNLTHQPSRNSIH
jgi:hypothetical protein